MRDGVDIGLISTMFTKIPHRYMTKTNRKTITILLHESCGWIIN